MVDSVDAHFIESGRLKLGRYEDYAQLENGRADGGEGRAVYTQKAPIRSGDPFADVAFRRMGLELTGGGHYAEGNTTIAMLPPTYCFCLMRPG
jgi:hypothetical protein